MVQLDLEASEIDRLVHFQAGAEIKRHLRMFPHVELDATIQPLTHDVIVVHLSITPCFEWHTRTHGMIQPWYGSYIVQFIHLRCVSNAFAF